MKFEDSGHHLLINSKFVFALELFGLNPVEKFWAWLRSRLRAMDLRDAVAKRPVLRKTAFRAPVRRLCQTKKAQKVAGNHARALKGVCRMILQKKGAHSGK